MLKSIEIKFLCHIIFAHTVLECKVKSVFSLQHIKAIPLRRAFVDTTTSIYMNLYVLLQLVK